MGFSIIKVKFTQQVHKPTKNYELGVPKMLLSILGYIVVSTISKERFNNLGENIPEKSVVCVHPRALNCYRNLEELYRCNINKAVGEELRRELIHYGMV